MKHQQRSARMVGVYGAIAAVVLLVVGAEAWISGRGAPGQSVPPASFPVSRVASPATSSDIRTVLAGHQLYRFYCASCHSGGSAATSNSATTSDLFAQMQLDRMSDDAVYRVVADGASGSAMPAFAGQMTDAQIWQLVSFLRSSTRPSVTTVPPLSSATTATTQPTALARSSIPDSPEPLPPLVFARDGNIWHSDGKNSQLRQLTQFTGFEYADQPTYEPKTNRVAFVTSTTSISSATRLPAAALYTTKLNGADRQLVWQTERGSLYLPTWTPDGTALYVTYTGAKDDRAASSRWQPQILRIDLASGARRIIVDNAHNQAPSRDGRQLAYVEVQENGYATALMIANADGSDARVLLQADLFSGFFAPRFSPDGTQIIVAAVGGPQTDARGIPITDQPDASFAPFLGWLAPPVAQAHGGVVLDLWIVDTDGSNLRRLTWFGEDLPMAVFSPDGTDIMIMAYGGIYRVGSDGSRLRRISLLGGHGAIDWLP